MITIRIHVPGQPDRTGIIPHELYRRVADDPDYFLHAWVDDVVVRLHAEERCDSGR